MRESEMAKKSATPEAEPAAAAPAAPPPAEAAPPAPAAAAAPAGSADGGATKKKKRPGAAPRRGKKLTNRLKNQAQKLAKEGTVNLQRAIAMLKQTKRPKFDETVEVHMHLGIDPAQN